MSPAIKVRSQDMLTCTQVANESWSAQTVAAVHGKRTYRHPLKELRSGKDYEARVLVVDQDGNYREHGVVAATFKTACESE
ncbi:hypothetical protein HPB48_026455 [Haemaphysalis longicornis]|uniref:Uncharacterized protein n=1 Tax=Haemaphysalis longicornis TaxID=44386 RepID=A0A9J6HC39_HAELO|nr:hypothetical protein HPB48_026455 [Haemaphysalis longicornis]